MHAILVSLLNQHQQLSTLVRLLVGQPSLEPDPCAPNAGLLLDVATYLTGYPGVSHHQLEDVIAGRLRARGLVDADIGVELEMQHVRLARHGADLLRDMEGTMRRESASMELVASNTRLYAERLRHNIAFEELVLFPSASKYFHEEDWQAVTAAVQSGADLAFWPEVERRFEGLRRAIVEEASCGCDASDKAMCVIAEPGFVLFGRPAQLARTATGT